MILINVSKLLDFKYKHDTAYQTYDSIDHYNRMKVYGFILTCQKVLERGHSIMLTHYIYNYSVDEPIRMIKQFISVGYAKHYLKNT